MPEDAVGELHSHLVGYEDLGRNYVVDFNMKTGPGDLQANYHWFSGRDGDMGRAFNIANGKTGGASRPNFESYLIVVGNNDKNIYVYIPGPNGAPLDPGPPTCVLSP